MSLMTFYFASAQNYLLEVKEDKKIIHPEKLELPTSTTAQDILQILPELLNRHGDFMISHYDIQVEGVSIGDMRDAILTQTILSDIKAIEVSESPISSYHNNGQGGVVDIKLKDAGKCHSEVATTSDNCDGFSGSVSLDASYQLDIVPTLQLKYKKEKISLRGFLSAEGYMPDDIKVKTTSPNGSVSTQYTDEKFLSQIARLYFDYNINSHSYLKLRLHESVTDFDKDITWLNSVRKEENSTDALNLLGKAEYKYTFDRKSHIQIEACYSNSPKDSKLNLLDKEDREWTNDLKSQTVSGKVEFCYPLLDRSKPCKVDFFLGSNYNYTWHKLNSNDNFDWDKESWLMTKLNENGNVLNLSPYFQTECQFGKVSLKTILEYQYFHYDLDTDFYYWLRDHSENDGSSSLSDVTAKIMLGWQVVDHQFLRLILDRKIERPSEEQIFPHLVYRSSANSIICGNSGLDPMHSHEATLDYVTDAELGNGYFTFNAALGYVHTDGIIKSEEKELGGTHYNYITYSNDGESDILKGLLMIYYRKNIFSISATANVYNNNQTSEKNPYTYGNFSVVPALSFKNHWNTSVGYFYNSAIKKDSEKLGSCSYLKLRVAKSWNQWEIHALGVLPLNGHTEDELYKNDGTSVVSHYLVQPSVNVGFRFYFPQ